MEQSESENKNKIVKLTNIHLSEYNSLAWIIESSDEFDAWFFGLDEKGKEAV